MALFLRGPSAAPGDPPESDASVVSCRGLEKAFGRNKVLDGVTCDIPRGPASRSC
jgi:ABC-type transporter Mla maintaining outer membrane lipid asymmetry ATPase subunit MlaF